MKLSWLSHHVFPFKSFLLKIISVIVSIETQAVLCYSPILLLWTPVVILLTVFLINQFFFSFQFSHLECHINEHENDSYADTTHSVSSVNVAALQKQNQHINNRK